MRVLLVEDDRDVALALKSALESHGFSVDVGETGEEGLKLASSTAYDIILLDHVLPGMHGTEVCAALRSNGVKSPILMLTVRASTDDKVEALDQGADDYLTKPFSQDELLARVRALLRRPQGYQGNVIQIEDLVIDTRKQSVLRGSSEIYLTRKEFSLLEYFAKNRGTVLSRNVIMEHVWDIHADPFSNTIETHIMTLRKKIDAPYVKKLIHTVQGRGYRLDAE